MREKARLGKAEKFMLDALRTFEEREGVPIVLLDSYEDAVDRYGLRDSRLNERAPDGGGGRSRGLAFATSRSFKRWPLSRSRVAAIGGRSSRNGSKIT